MILKSIFISISTLVLSYSQISLGISLDDLESEEEEESISPSETAIEWSGLIDFKLANAGKDLNWSHAKDDYGGPGLTRYGASPDNHKEGARQKRATNFHLGMIGLVADFVSQGETIAHLQLNYSDHRASSNGRWGGLGLAEGFIFDEFSIFELRLGFLIPPISLEHPEVAWSTRYTITPSAINSWIGEEVRSLGLEINAKIFDNASFMLAAFSHNDAIGTMLTYRGWALHDYQATYGTRLRWNKVPEEINETNGWVEPFKEIDDKLGLYSQLHLSTSDKSTNFKLFYYNNFATPDRFDGHNYAWKTEFWNLSLSKQFSNGLELLSQYLVGETKMGPVDVVHAKFDSYYILASYQHEDHRFSLRYDNFKVEDKDNFVFPSGATDDNNSKGTSIAAAYLFNLTEKKIIGFEYLMVQSERNGNEGYGTKDPDDDLAQIMYRVKM